MKLLHLCKEYQSIFDKFSLIKKKQQQQNHSLFLTDMGIQL